VRKELPYRYGRRHELRIGFFAVRYGPR
jgi:hypothetical protein